MRTWLAVGAAGAVLVSMMMAATATAQPRRGVVESAGVTLDSFSVSPTIGYPGGPLVLDVAVHNGRPVAEPQLMVMVGAAGLLTSARREIPAMTTSHIGIDDPGGLGGPNLCSPRDYAIQINGAGVNAPNNTISQTYRVSPTCAFKTQIVIQEDQAAPDRVDAWHQSHMYLSAFTIHTEPSCTSALTVTVTIANQTRDVGHHLQVALVTPTGELKRSAPFDLPAGVFAANGTLQRMGSVTLGIPDVNVIGSNKVNAKLVDPAGKVTTEIYDPGISLMVTPHCTLGVHRL